MAPLDALRDGLFEEMKARIKETDMSVPARRGPWWYYTRTEEGKDYAIHCRRPARGREELPPAGEPGEEEQILLDENVAGGGVGVLRRRQRRRQPRPPLAGLLDRPCRRREVRAALPAARRRDPAGAAAESVPDTGYGLAWSAAGDYVFYVRMDEAQRPFQLWRHRLGTRPGRRRPRLRGGRPALLARHRLDPRRGLRAHRPAQHQHHRVARHPRRPTRWPSPVVVLPRREGVEYAVDHLAPAGGGAGGSSP